MGCCILGALIIGRWIHAWRRMRGWICRDGPRRALVAAEAGLLVAAALYEVPAAHRDHLLSLLTVAADAAPSAICSGGGGPAPP